MDNARSAAPAGKKRKAKSSRKVSASARRQPPQPPTLPPRPPSKGNKREILADIAKRIPVDVMRRYFNYPLRSAAEVSFIFHRHISYQTCSCTHVCRVRGESVTDM